VKPQNFHATKFHKVVYKAHLSQVSRIC